MLKPALLLSTALQLNAVEPERVRPSPAPAPSEPVEVATTNVYDGSARQLDIVAPRLSDPSIRIDGRIDEAAWGGAAVLGGFTQYQPVEGSPASERTEVRVLLSDDAIYFAARADDSSGGVRATLSQRDRFERSNDYVRFVLDTFNDQRRAYAFTVNPFGVQGDGLWVEGSGGRRWGPIDSNPDFLWESAGRVDDRGYSVEIRIPLKSLRFPESEVQDWGLQVIRKIQRTGYEQSWAPISSERANRLAQSGALRGLRGLDSGLFMEINPTATGSRQGAYDAGIGGLTRDAAVGDFGLNLTYGLTSNLTLDGTINPDFSQIEADAGQIAVNERFALFLQEKRPFFLEGTDVFSMPEQLVYTRSIVNPVGAAKLSGKVGSFQVAYLGAVDDVNAGQDNPVVNLVRFKRDVGRSSTLGMVYTDRTLPGASFNRVVGSDARLVLGGRYTVSLMAAGSADGSSSSPTDWGSLVSASVRRSSRGFSWNASLEDVSDGFRARSGFIRRTGVTQVRAGVSHTFWGDRGSLVESWGPSLDVEGLWNRDAFWAGRGTQESEVSLGLSASLRNNIGGFVSLRRSAFDFAPEHYERFFSGPDEAALSPLRRPSGLFSGLHSVSVRSWISSWERARISLGASWSETPLFAGLAPVDVGQAWNGDLGLTLYPTGSLETEVGVRHVTILRERDGSRYSSATIPRLQGRYQFSRALFARAITEYSSQERGALLDPVTGEPVFSCTDECSARAGSERHDFRLEGLLGYEPSPGTVVFVGYTRQFRDTQAFAFRDFRTQADGLFVKLSYRFRM